MLAILFSLASITKISSLAKCAATCKRGATRQEIKDCMKRCLNSSLNGKTKKERREEVTKLLDEYCKGFSQWAPCYASIEKFWHGHYGGYCDCGTWSMEVTGQSAYCTKGCDYLDKLWVEEPWE
ncbi:hypothetical protein GPJ56_005669 [Histomonas meleagridis]|uniref:uncharacterized protein n=1 Tax=Histomonas meleagridis TaxID=135588 RepID=UPI0035594123|nr:hypothetical protein GPJ56_005669 [Histomonas meleagridis]KAH0803396.1 hypothetical protein GO595_003740 [Histomonas meleagridis]